MKSSGAIIGLIALACLLGGMVFFGVVMAPLVFTKLLPGTADLFIRATFPRYYAYVAVTAGLASFGLLLRGNFGQAIILALVLMLTIWLWHSWLPHLNQVREAGNQAAFAWGHRLSVWLNGAQLLAVLAVLIAVARQWRRN